MPRSRTFTTATLLCSALAVSLVASGCNNRSDRDDTARSGDTSATYGGATPDTGAATDTNRSFGGTTPSRSLSDSDPAETTATPRRTRRSSSTRRMTPAERELYQQGQWDSTRLQQDTTKLQQTPTPDTAKVDSTSYGNLYAPQRDTSKAVVTQQNPPLQQDTLSPDTLRPQPDTTQPDTTKPDTAAMQQQQPIAADRPDTAANQPQPAQPADVRAPAEEGGEPTDAQIVQLAISVNSADSSAGELAQTRATNAQVRDFARMMVQDHGAANQRIRELVQRLTVTPDSTWDENRTLGEESRDAIRELATKSGADFDREYIEHEIELHEDVLEKLDEKLIPKADNAELKTLLQETRQTVQRHLERARELQNTLRQ